MTVAQQVHVRPISDAHEITHGQVRESIAVARSHGEKFFEQIVWQVENEVWTILGYTSWEEMRQAEYADMGVVAPRADRPELVSRLRSRGLTQQETADTLGVSRDTIKRDDAASKGQMHLSDDDAPDTITNARGQKRPASYKQRPPATPEPEPVNDVAHAETVTPEAETPSSFDTPKPQHQEAPQPRRKPLPDAFWTARYDLGKKVESLHRLTADDRFPTNKKKVAEANLNDLLQCRDLLQQVIDQLTTHHEG